MKPFPGKMGNMDIVAINLRRLRRMRGLLQKELAGRAGVDTSNLSKLERGEYTWTKDSLTRLAAALDVSLDEFFAPDGGAEESGGGPISSEDQLRLLSRVNMKLDWLLAGMAAFDEGIFAASTAMRGVAGAGAPLRKRA
jgi:transcriptional regulator with XRE-family HTH domain